MAEDAVLGYLAQNSDLSDSRNFARDSGFDYDEVINVIKSLNGFQYVVATEYEERNWVLTDEGKEYAAEGSPEFRLFSAVPAEGISLKELEAKVGPTVFRNGRTNAMKNKWLIMGKELVTRKVEHVEDKVKDSLTKIQKKELVDQAGIDELKKRKLIAEQKLKGYSVVKGINFAPKRRKAATGLTRENLQRCDWKDLEFKEYNFAAKGLPSEGGYLHPLLKSSYGMLHHGFFTTLHSRNSLLFLLLTHIDSSFEEMPTNNYVESSFWNFDALFQPQQHPARDSHDTFRSGSPSTTKLLPEDYVERVKQVHEVGGYGSRGYSYDWKREEANKNLLRTHTTAVSSRMLYQLAQKPFAPKKYFSIDRVFRNEAVDRTHLAEFHQIEGLICDRDLTLGDLIGVLQDLFSRLGMSKLRFKPAYNPYTEPSMEIFSYHEGFKKWVEIGNSGMFRPEMLLPMGLPEDVRVIAWGLSLERPTMILYGIDNIRDLFGHKTDLTLIKKNPICRIGLQ
uniref:phenylalanine--tRNA ligase n=1 Tax=Kalanchoe fedtschenkoi TaxID=63787 RepID=A0A7N0ZTY6_KALFE